MIRKNQNHNHPAFPTSTRSAVETMRTPPPCARRGSAKRRDLPGRRGPRRPLCRPHGWHLAPYAGLEVELEEVCGGPVTGGRGRLASGLGRIMLRFVKPPKLPTIGTTLGNETPSPIHVA